MIAGGDCEGEKVLCLLEVWSVAKANGETGEECGLADADLAKQEDLHDAVRVHTVSVL